MAINDIANDQTNEKQTIALYMRYMLFFVYAHIPVYAAISVIYNFDLVLPLLLQLLLAAIITFGYLGFRYHAVGYDLSSMVITATPAVLVYMMSGHPWQIDAHMYFFATLAMVTGFKSIRALIMGAAIIALHHLSLNFLLPAAIFPGGANFGRVVFHAVIVVVEAAVIGYTIYGLKRNDQRIRDEMESSQKAMQEAQEAKTEQERLEKENKDAQKQAMAKIADNLEKQVGAFITSLEDAASKLQELAKQMENSSRTSKEHVNTLDEAAQTTTNNVQTVASSADELSASIKEIAGNINQSASVAQECASSAETSQQSLKELQEAVEQIDTVIEAINNVAEQTNMLALNATIEAARAGDAGKGFAVVANEVKSLAGQTNEMTDEISQKVDAVKQGAAITVTSVQDILDKIQSVDEKTGHIAASIEEQSSATDEISRNTQQAADKTNAFSDTVSDIDEAAKQNAIVAQNLTESADHLSSQSRDLKSAVEEFVSELRTQS